MPKYKLTDKSCRWYLGGQEYKPGDVVEVSKEFYELINSGNSGVQLIEVKEEKKETKQ